VNPDVEMVVIGLRDNQDWHFPDFDLARIEEMGAALAEVIAEREAAGEAVLLILTTDLVHYVPREQADQEDPILLDHIARLDAAGLYESVAEQELSICGEVPIAVGMTALRALGATELELLAYDTSDSRTGDSSSVVGYASGRVLP
jgi:AmmeMemoRadiSam system protein B